MGQLFSQLTGLETAPAPLRPLRIGWLVATAKIQSASVRYRCFHMARVLAQTGVESLYFTDIETLSTQMARLDAVIAVKRMDVGVMRIAAAAERHGKPMFLDLCDDLLSPRYAKNADGVNGLMFAGLAPRLAGVTVPSAAMAERVRTTAAKLGAAVPPVHVIPDIAETRALYHLTERFLNPGASAPSEPPLKRTSRRRQVLWFGNFGAPHSNFGIFSLLPTLPALSAVNRETSLELVVISNNEPLFQSLTEGADFPTRYIPWTPAAIYDALEMADVALLTGGTDEFCTVKSSNRPLQALAAGVPVITEASTALTEFADIVLLGSYEHNLRRVLSTDPATRHRCFVAPAAPILARYSPQALAGLWRGLLTRACSTPGRVSPPAISAPAPQSRPRRAMLLAEAGAKPDTLARVLKSADQAGLDRELLMPAEAAANPELRQAVAKARLIQRVFAATDKLTASLLSGVDVLCIAGPDGAAAKALRPWAARADIPVVAADPKLDWETLLPVAAPTQPKSPIQPGPYPETPGPDGSADWIFVVHPNNRGWILDAISREIGARQLQNWTVAYNPRHLPQAKTYFFSHYSLFQGGLKRSPEALARAKSLVWYTHPRNETPESIATLLAALNQATKVIFTCRSNYDLWLERGLDPDRAAVVLGGADPEFFTGHARGGGAVGLSSSFYERKNPDRLRELVHLMPHRRFHLVGRAWEQYALFGDLLAAPNFHYDTAPYSAYPGIYKGFDVFLSMSKLEGGPIPLLEAMMENAVPVASNTGFAPDIIRPGETGFLFEPDAPAEEIAALIDRAFALTADVRASVRAYDWDSFGRRIVEFTQ